VYGILLKKRHLEEREINGRIKLEVTLGRERWMVMTYVGSNRLRIVSSGGLCY
jgi:hypothetical protein